ncbi:hypothetical protein Bbelb_110040 [Branchiostoma belcheri]|nr:hypothetical protein Bbelb_110040 [Branchiostoma belcheri]
MLLQSQNKPLGETNSCHFFPIPRAICPSKFVTLACPDHEISKPEVLLRYLVGSWTSTGPGQNQCTWEPENKAVTSGDQRTLCGYNGKDRGLVLHGAVSGSGGSKKRVQEGIPGEDGTLWSPAVLYGRFPEIDDSRRSEQRDCLKGFMY